MAAPLLAMPLSALRDVIEASAGLVDVAKDLASVAEGVKDPALQRRLEIEILASSTTQTGSAVPSAPSQASAAPSRAVSDQPYLSDEAAAFVG